MTAARRLLSATVAVVVLLGGTGVALATQPVTTPLLEASSEPIDCGVFAATLSRTLTGKIQEFVDSSGQPSRVQAEAQMRGSLSGNGRDVALAGNLLVVIDLVRGTFAYNGSVFLASDPGNGVVLQDTGRFLTTFDDELVLEAGPHDAIDNGAAAFCGALS